jgi:predicted Rossmann fold nucleotide-binding protein DprA/Smf involved in DNA uptake
MPFSALMLKKTEAPLLLRWSGGAFVCTELSEIPGIGEKTVQNLMAHFGSPKKVSEALASEIEEVTNLNTAKKIQDWYRDKGNLTC